ncbi:nucleotidyltransferase domain-containing protein, partial [Clavibacter michiganensis]
MIDALDIDLAPVVAEQPFPVLFATVSGAHLYGFPSRDSDVDLRGAHLLPAADLVGLREPEETRSRMWDRDGVEMDLVTHDLRKFVRLMLRRNGYVLEQLLSPLVVHTTEAHRELAGHA